MYFRISISWVVTIFNLATKKLESYYANIILQSILSKTKKPRLSGAQ
jgi:hypothetical protein